MWCKLCYYRRTTVVWISNCVVNLKSCHTTGSVSSIVRVFFFSFAFSSVEHFRSFMRRKWQQWWYLHHRCIFMRDKFRIQRQIFTDDSFPVWYHARQIFRIQWFIPSLMSEVEDTGTGVIFTYIGDINNETNLQVVYCNAVVIRRKKMCCLY